MTPLPTVAALPPPFAPERNGATPGGTAVIDIGSGSARAVVMRVNAGGAIEIVAQQRVNLNLMSHLDTAGALDAAGVSGALAALEDFALVARAYGVRSIHAVATAALRESGNASVITDAARRRFAIPLRIIDGADEAAYCFLGAVHGLPAAAGLLADIGGGSTELVRFANRELQSAISLPIGSLRLANRFALTDRPAPRDLAAAVDYVRSALSDAGAPARCPGGVLAGSGGSVRLLARLARSREEIYPIVRIHGYEIGASELASLTRTLASLSGRQRAGMVGMNPERAHSIVGGAVIAHALAQHACAPGILVSGQGLREGLARHPGPLPPAGCIALPPLAAVRRAALSDLARRFASRYSVRGPRRAAVAARIAAAAWPADGRRPTLADALESAAFLLDLGDAVDFYNRQNRTASIIVRTDLPGFTHRESAQMAAILLTAERGQPPRRFRQSRLLPESDARPVAQAAVILTLADALERRLPPEMPPQVVQVRRKSGTFTIQTPAWSDAAAEPSVARWAPALGEPIAISIAPTPTPTAATTTGDAR